MHHTVAQTEKFYFVQEIFFPWTNEQKCFHRNFMADQGILQIFKAKIQEFCRYSKPKPYILDGNFTLSLSKLLLTLGA
jgi:hypothetical protein